MGRTRQTAQALPSQPTSESRLTPEQKAAFLIGAILAGSVSVPNPPLAIAQILLSFVPSTISDALSASVSAQVTRLVVQDPPDLRGGSPAHRAASEANLSYRALYGIAAIKRVVKAIRGESEESLEERLDKAIAVEKQWFAQHKEARVKREQAAALVDAAAERWGDMLGWYSVLDSGTDRRCKELHGTNLSVSSPPDGFYPGWRDGGNCRCSPGAPFSGAEDE